MKNCFLRHAIHYHSLGVNVVCISSKQNIHNFKDYNLLKSPNHEWHQFIEIRQSAEYVKSLKWKESVGIGIILGYNNICAIDIDGCIDFKLVRNILKILDIPDNYEWIFKSGSNAGYHIIFRCQNIVEIENKEKQQGTKIAAHSEKEQPFGNGDTNAYYPEYSPRGFTKIEFKWTGNLVLPYSLHISGNKYKIISKIPKLLPINVDFERILAVKLYYASLQAVNSELFSFRIQSVAKKDEEIFNYLERRIEPYILISHSLYIIKDNNRKQLGFDTFLFQICWLILDKNFNVIKRKTYNYYKSQTTQRAALEINIHRAEHIVVDKRNALLELVFDINHSAKVVVHDNSSLNIIKEELISSGLFLDCFKKTEAFYSNNEIALLNSIDNKEIVFLDMVKKRTKISIYDLYSYFLALQNIKVLVRNVTITKIESLINQSKFLIDENTEIKESDDIYNYNSSEINESICDDLDYQDTTQFKKDNFGRYSGSWAQDVEGLSDEFIDDVLGGDPSAYWNID